MFKTKKSSCFGAIVVVFFLVFIDQVTKSFALNFLKNQTDIMIIPKVLELHYLENTGAAFSILTNQMWLFYILTPLFCTIILYIFYKLPVTRHFIFAWWILVVLFAGALGNFVDRIFHHFVIDFIYFSLIDFPVFNVADMYVTISMIALMIAILFVYKDNDYNIVFGKKNNDSEDNK